MQVTVMGPSAGAQSTALHLTMKQSDALFAQAILQDNPFTAVYRTKSEFSSSVGEVFAKYLNCSVRDGFCMRTRSAEEILDAQIKTSKEINNLIDIIQSLSSEVWGPVIDGDYVEDNPLSVVKEGKLHQKPLIIGANRDEARVIITNNTLSTEAYLATLLLVFDSDAWKIAAKYPPHPLDNNAEQLSAVLTDYLTVCSNRYVARIAEKAQPVYHYIYSVPTPEDFEVLASCVNYSCHASDVIPAYGTFSLNDIVPSQDMKQASDSMLYYWLNFAHTGDPSDKSWDGNRGHKDNTKSSQKNKDRTDADSDIFIKWPRYSGQNGWQSLDIKTPTNGILYDFRSDFCNFWDDLLNMSLQSD